MEQEFDWSLSRTFLAVVRAGSFSGAARRLRQAPPTVRRQIEQLETVVGAQLFSRFQDGVRPTPIADRLAPLAERIEAAADAFARGSRTERLAGIVRIAADAIIATRLLPDVLVAIQAAHGGLRFDVRTIGDPGDAGSRATDLTVAFERPTWEGMIASRVATLPTGLYASRSWVERHGTPAGPADLAGPARLVGDPDASELATTLGCGVDDLRVDRLAVGTRSREAGLAAILAGLGAGVLPNVIAKREPGLVRLLPGIGSTLDVWMWTHPDLKDVPQVRVTIDALRTGLRGSSSTASPRG